MELNDQVLSSYLDGELDQRARAEVEAVLATDAGARVRLERLRGVDDLLRKAIPELPRTDEDPIARRIDSYDGRSPELPPTRRPQRATVALLALAAGITGLAIGIVGSGLMRGTRDVMDARVIAALNTRSSGEQESRDGRTVGIVLSFRSTDGRYCRVFDVASSDVSGEGIACRAGARWQLAGWDGTHATGGFQPAGGEGFIDGVMDRLGGKAALEPAAERKLIDANWKD